jgi:nucleoside phosphorylase
MTVGIPLAVEQELVVHLFAPADGPLADRADGQVRLLWSRCRDGLGMTEPIGPTGLSARLPGDLGAQPESAAIAAQQSPDADFQAVLRREHDVLQLSLLLARTADSQRSRALWPALDQLLDTILGRPAGSLIGMARLYLAKVAEGGPAGREDLASPRVGSALSTLLPAAPQATGWWHRGLATPSGLAVWELSAREETRTERWFVAVAPPDGDRELSAWTWSSGGTRMPPFARYLMHTAKVRYELQVRASFPAVGQLCQRVDDEIADLRGLVRDVTAGQRDARANQGARDAHRGAAVTDRLGELQADRVQAAELRTTLTAMRRTVEIAEANAVAALGTALPDAGGSHLMADDRAVAAWLRQQLDDDIAYLEASLDGAGQVADVVAGVLRELQPDLPSAGPAFGIITALPEEFAAMQALIDGPQRRDVEDDPADYVVGTVPSPDPDRPHLIALTLLGETGNDAAANACANLVRSFGSVRCVLMVGIAAGVPDPGRPDRHVRLGDVVVATWGIAEYDSVTDEASGPVSRREFPPASPRLERRAKMLAAGEAVGIRPWEDILARTVSALPGFGRPEAGTDLIYAADDSERLVPHPDLAASGHRPGWPKVHYGRIGSGERSLRSARKRDELAAAHDVLAIEMEGKGVGNTGFSIGVEWFVVRGISDYGDRRTGRAWRYYAALAAAAYTRALLEACPAGSALGGRPASAGRAEAGRERAGPA